MATWKRILTTDDAVTDTNIGTSNLTISSSARTLTLGEAGGTGLFRILESGGSALLTVSKAGGQSQVTVGGDLKIQSDPVGSDAGVLKIYPSGQTTNFIGLKSPSLTSATTFVLPDADGTNGQALVTDGSGNLSFSTISGSGSIDGTGAAGKLALWSDSDTLTSETGISYSTSNDRVTAGQFNATASGTDGDGTIFSVTTDTHRILIKTSGISTAGQYGRGTRVFSKLGSGTVAAGKLYYLGSNGTWALADKDALSTSSGLIAVADFNSSSFTMIQEGMVKMASNQGWNTAPLGAPIYVGDSGNLTASISTFTTGDVVRIVGHIVNPSSAIIYFNPDQSYIKVA